MLRSSLRRLFFIIVGLFLLPSLAVAATARIDVTDVEINGDDADLNADDDDNVHVWIREDDIIKLSFSYEVGSNSEVEKWFCMIGTESGTQFDSGEFSNSKATISFKTADIVKAAGSNNSIPYQEKTLYDYKLVLKLQVSDTKPTTDGDYEYSTSDTDSGVVNRQSQEVIIHVDMDPPGPITLEDNPRAGEKSLYVSWSASKLSVGGNDDSGIKVTFCVKPVTTSNEETQQISKLVDGDMDSEEAELEDAELEAVADGDADQESLEAEEETEEEGDSQLGDLDLDKPETLDRDIPDRGEDLPDGDAKADGDTENFEDIADCINPVPNGTSDNPYRITGLENGKLYRIWAKGVDKVGNQSEEWSNPIEGTPQPVDDFWEYYKKSGGKEKGGFCFVATAAYGDYNAPEVRVLRVFRDKVLLTNAPGRAFVNTYYRYSPEFASMLKMNPLAAEGARLALWPLVLLIVFFMGLTPVFQLGLGASAFGGLLLFHRVVLRGKEARR